MAGFEPFGGWTRNPSETAAKALARDRGLRARGVRTVVLPVHRVRAPQALHAAVQRWQPEILVLTGLAASRTVLTLERIGVNWYRSPKGGPGRRIVDDGPDALFSTLPWERSLAALRRGGPAEMSESAGTYACNLVLYLSLLGRGESGPRLAGFVHLPPTVGCAPPAARPGAAAPALDDAAVARSLRALCLELLRDRRRSPRGDVEHDPRSRFR